MKLAPNGIDVFYIDESNDQRSYVLAAITVPMMRMVDGDWHIVWPERLGVARDWRRTMSRAVKIPAAKELHGNKLISGRGNFFKGQHNFDRAKANGVYRSILRNLDQVLLPGSIMAAAARRGTSTLYGKTRLEAALYALLQRMRTQSDRRGVNAMVFFDQGHPEYRKLYRQAQVHLPTGSMVSGGWGDGRSSKNLSLGMFFKDANEKNSKHCQFTQIADLIAFAAFLKIKAENGELEPWQAQYGLGTLFDEIPKSLLNTAVSASRDGIKRLG
ncbi:MAG: DUF3800 domain-containing protein [Alphaproteobacteria bacterium]|nr:DUF3800 domain-containing protein [Alphaproteobacteria bacterium]MBU1527402.1 DUF3800 domain-containing protein [Alphaproteobacteria bacterium]MBU2350805.1 DUF3800 domain-containing protein [Alphaproteobacteria bacterium]MBU2381146.1 DUF3800 domain-containing protein [Alphaproteobacteria bacterium]